MQFNLISDLAPRQSLALDERGLHYGDGIFETMLLHQGKIYYWDQHYERLQASAKRLFIPCPDQAWFDQKLQGYINLQQTLVLKIILTRGYGGRGLSLPDTMIPNIYLLKYKHNLTNNQSVITYFSGITLPKNPNLNGLKHLNRLDYVLATQEMNSKSTFNEALLLNTDGFVIEGIVHNLFFVLDEKICTPDLTESGVNGVIRQMILKKLKAIGKNVKIGNFSKQDILLASECFLCNSVQGIRPVRQIEDKKYPVGPITAKLQNYFHVESI